MNDTIGVSWLHTDIINIDESYQRPITKSSSCHEIIKNGWHDESAGICTVSCRITDKLYYMIDGRNRLYAAVRLGIQKLRCKIIHSDGPHHEASIFYNMNAIRHNPSVLERFNAKVISGDEFCIELNIAIKNLNIILGGRNKNGAAYASDIISSYKQNKEATINALSLARDIISDEDVNMHNYVFIGIFNCLIEDINRYQLIRKELNSIKNKGGQGAIIRRVKTLQQIDKSHRVGPLATQAFKDIYNKKKTINRI
jgi:hypothetical protein